MQIYCRSCGKEIQAENINLDKMIAKCSHCNAVFSFADMYEGVQAKQKSSFDAPTPQGIIVHREYDHLLIERKWSSVSGFFMLFFAVIWNGMIWGIFVPAFSFGDDMFFHLFLVPFILAGIYIAYMGLATIVNTTKIRVDNSALDIRHEPLPFPSRHLAVNDIEQLFTRQRISHSKNGTTVSYELLAIRNDAKEVSLLSNLERAEFALFIENEIENYLGIQDRPVLGEYR